MDLNEEESKPTTSGVINLKEELSSSDSEGADSGGDDKEKILHYKVTEDYTAELEADLAIQKVKRTRNKLSKMPLHLKGLMGEANLRFARGDRDVCEKMCFEIIRQAPFVFEPYVTLSQIYEGEHVEKCLQYLTIAAHLKPYDVDQWCRLAQMHSDGNNMRKAITCYTKALQYEPNNYTIQKKRIEILEALGDQKFITRCQARLLNTLNPEIQADEMMVLAKELVHKYHVLNEYSKAIEVLNVSFNKIPDKITPEFVNIMLELLLLNKNYPECLDVFVQFCNIEMEVFIEENNKIRILNFNMPPNIQIDLKIKFLVCLIKLNEFGLLHKLIDPLLIEEDVEQVGDLFLDVAEALMLAEKPEIALKLLIPLIKSKNFFLAAVWLKYAECLEACQMFEQAIDSYMTVVRMAPQHFQARHTLYELLVKYEKYEEALNITNQDVSSGDLDVELLIKQINLLHKLDNFDGYCNAMDLLFSRHCIMVKRYEEIQFMIMLHKYTEKTMKIIKVRQLRFDKENVMYNCLNEPTVENEYALIDKCLAYCFEKKRFDKLQKYSFQSLLVHKFKNYFNQMYFRCFCTALFNNDVYHAYRIVRELVFHYPNSTFLWNLLNMCPRKIEKITKFVLHFMDENIDNNILKIFEANNALVTGNFKMAAMHLMPYFKSHECPPPHICMFMAVALAQMCRQKNTKMKEKLTQTVYSLFLTYVNNRGKEAKHETFYNLGRLYQHFGISHLAAYYYKKVFEYTNPLIEKYPDVLDLRRETAFNLFLLYKECKNYVLAKKILVNHLTI